MNNKYIISLFKGKGSALNRGNYCCLKKSSGNVKSLMLCSLVSFLDRGQLILSSLSDNFKKNFWTKIKTFILVSLILKRFSIEYHIKYNDGLCMWQVYLNGLVLLFKVRVNGSYSDTFEFKVGVHQGSVLYPLLFIIVLQA